MAYAAVDKCGNEWKFDEKPIRHRDHVWDVSVGNYTNAEELRIGSIEKLIGRKLTWEDDPVELKEGIPMEHKTYVAVDEDSREVAGNVFPDRFKGLDVSQPRWWNFGFPSTVTILQKGSIEKLIGRKLTWEDEPVELKDEK